MFSNIFLDKINIKNCKLFTLNNGDDDGDRDSDCDRDGEVMVSPHSEAEECHYWLQEEAALQGQSFRDADPQPVIPQKESGWNVLEIARKYKTWLEISGHEWRFI